MQSLQSRSIDSSLTYPHCPRGLPFRKISCTDGEFGVIQLSIAHRAHCTLPEKTFIPSQVHKGPHIQQVTVAFLLSNLRGVAFNSAVLFSFPCRKTHWIPSTRCFPRFKSMSSSNSEKRIQKLLYIPMGSESRVLWICWETA